MGLAVGVLFVWGLIVFKVFKAAQGNSQIIHNENRDFVTDFSLGDTLNYNLNMNFKDPFLKNITKERKKDNKEIKRTKNPGKPKVVKKVKKIPLKWPEISYLGMVKSKSREIGIINIGSKSQLGSEGDTIHGVLIMNINEDSVVVKYGVEIKNIHKLDA